MQLLLVEDDRMIGEAVVTALQDAAYVVDWEQRLAQVPLLLFKCTYDLLLLDLNLPDGDGLETLRDLRARRFDIAVIILTARDGLEARITGLDLGADDYLEKPFAIRELLARIRAVQRRRSGLAQDLLQLGSWSINLKTHEAHGPDQAYWTLSNREFALLRILALHPGRLHNRRQLEEAIYGAEDPIESNTIDVLIHGLRRKLGAELIRNVRGAGWFIANY